MKIEHIPFVQIPRKLLKDMAIGSVFSLDGIWCERVESFNEYDALYRIMSKQFCTLTRKRRRNCYGVVKSLLTLC